MITTAQQIEERQRVHLEAFKVNEIERRTLREMARELGVPKSAIIRDGLQMVFTEYAQLQKAAHESAAA